MGAVGGKGEKGAFITMDPRDCSLPTSVILRSQGEVVCKYVPCVYISNLADMAHGLHKNGAREWGRTWASGGRGLRGREWVRREYGGLALGW